MYILRQMKYSFSFVLKNKQNNVTGKFFVLSFEGPGCCFEGVFRVVL